MILSFLYIPHIPVGYAGGTTPRPGEVELRREQQSRATQGVIGMKTVIGWLHLSNLQRPFSIYIFILKTTDYNKNT